MKRNIMLPKAIIKKYMTLGLCSTMALSNIPVISVMANTSSTPTAPPVSGYTEPLPGTTTSTSTTTSTPSSSSSSSSSSSTPSSSSSSSSSSSTPSSSSSSSASSKPSTVSTTSTSTSSSSSSSKPSTVNTTSDTTETTGSATHTNPSGDNAVWTDANGNTYSYLGKNYNYEHKNVLYGIFEIDAVDTPLDTPGASITVSKGHAEITLSENYEGGTIEIPAGVTVLDEITNNSGLIIDRIDFNNVGSSFRFDAGVLDGLEIGDLRFEETSLTLDTISEAFSDDKGSVEVIYISETLYNNTENTTAINTLLDTANANAITCITTDLKTAMSSGFKLDANVDFDSLDPADTQKFINEILEPLLPVTAPSNSSVKYELMLASDVASISATETDPSGHFEEFAGKDVVVKATITLSDGSKQIIVSAEFNFNLNFTNKDILYLNLEDTKEAGGYINIKSAEDSSGADISDTVINSDGNLFLDNYTNQGEITVVLEATPRSGYQLDESAYGGQVWNTAELRGVPGITFAEFKSEIENNEDGTNNPTDYSLLTLTIDTATFDNEKYVEVTVGFKSDPDAQNALTLLLDTVDTNGKGSAKITSVELYDDVTGSLTPGNINSTYWDEEGLYLTGFEDDDEDGNDYAGKRIFVTIEATPPDKYLLESWNVDDLKDITDYQHIDEDDNTKLTLLINPATFNSAGHSIEYTFTPDPIYLIELDDTTNGKIEITSVQSNTLADITPSTVYSDGTFSLADYEFRDYNGNDDLITITVKATPDTHTDITKEYVFDKWDTTELESMAGFVTGSIDEVENEDGSSTLTFKINPKTFKNISDATISASFKEEDIPDSEPEDDDASGEPATVSVSYAMPIDDVVEGGTTSDTPQFVAKVIGYQEGKDLSGSLDLIITDTIEVYGTVNPDDPNESFDLEIQDSIDSTTVVDILSDIKVVYQDITIYEGTHPEDGANISYQNVGTITAPAGTKIDIEYPVSEKSLHASYVKDKINVDIEELYYIKENESDADSDSLGKSFSVPTAADNQVITLYYNPIYSYHGVMYETSIIPRSSGGYLIYLEAYGFLKSYMNSIYEGNKTDDAYLTSDEYMYKTYGYLIKYKEYVYVEWNDGVPTIVDEEDVRASLKVNDAYDLVEDPSKHLKGDDEEDGYSREEALLKNDTIQVPDFVAKITGPNATTYQLNHGSDNKVSITGDLDYLEAGDGSYTSAGIFNTETTRYIDDESPTINYGTININLTPDREYTYYYDQGNIRYEVTQSGDDITVKIYEFLGGATFLTKDLEIYFNVNGDLIAQNATSSYPRVESVTNYNNIIVPAEQVEGITTISSLFSSGGDPVVITFVHEDYETVTLETENGIILPSENFGNTRTSITLTENTSLKLTLLDTRIIYTPNEVKYIIEDRGDGYKAHFLEIIDENYESITIASTIQVNTYDGVPVRQTEDSNGWVDLPVETTFSFDLSEAPKLKVLSLPAGSLFTLTHAYDKELTGSFVEGGSASGSINTSSFIETIFEVKGDTRATFNIEVTDRDTSGSTKPDTDDDTDSDGNTDGDNSGGTTPDTDDDSSGGTTKPDTDDDSSGGTVTPDPDKDDEDEDEDEDDKDVYYTIRNQSSSRLELDVTTALAGDKVIIYYEDLEDDEEISVTTASGSTVKTYTEKSGSSVYFTMPAETVYIDIDTVETDAENYYLTTYLEEDEGYIRINGTYVSTDGKKTSIEEGEAVTLRAYAEDGYIFDSWSISGSARADVKAQLQEQEDEYNDALYEDDDDEDEDDDDKDDIVELDIYSEKTIDIVMPSGDFSITANFIADEDYDSEDDEEEEEDTTSTTPTMPSAPSVTVPDLDYNGGYNPNYNTDNTSPYAMLLGRYIDVQSHWGKDAIGYMLNRGLFNGTATNQFSPNLQMTRAMFVTVLSRIDNVNTSIMPVTPFTDVSSTSWYSGEVSWAINNRIATGKTATTFEPDNSITREDMALFLYNYMIEAGLTLPLNNGAISFVDSGDISANAATAVKYMQQAGIIEGKGSGVFDPKGYSTRAEVCSLLMRFLEATGK